MIFQTQLWNYSDHFDNSYNNIINNDFLSEIQNLSNNNITNDSSHLGDDNNNTNSGGDNNTALGIKIAFFKMIQFSKWTSLIVWYFLLPSIV